MADRKIFDALRLLDRHHEAFFSVEQFATLTRHPVPMDTRGWSQILVSILTGVKGLARQKGPDLEDGSDVKGANTWHAIDTPRFNGVIKSGTKAPCSDDMTSLDAMPNLYFVLWDQTIRGTERCRVWVVRPQHDIVFRSMCKGWYDKRISGEITSNNCQLQPPRGNDSNILRNTFGVLECPLLFCAERMRDQGYELIKYAPDEILNGQCSTVS